MEDVWLDPLQLGGTEPAADGGELVGVREQPSVERIAFEKADSQARPFSRSRAWWSLVDCSSG